MTSDDKVTYFGETDSRNKRVKFGIKAEDRTRHVYVIGKTGMGKSTLLENMAVQDIQGGEGLAFIDPHGKSAELLLNYIPENRIKDVVYFAPFDVDNPISFNVMEDVGYDKRHLVVSGLMSTFKKIWLDAWSARMEYILSNTLLALLEYPDATLLGVNKMLSDKVYRKKVVDNITDPAVKSFWVDEFGKYTEKFAAEATPAIQNKIGQFTNNPLIRNIIGQPKSSFDVRKMMDERKILIINLSKGRVGESNANLLGSMLITKIYLGAMSRADVSEKTMKSLPNFYLYVDEFQSFANESFADILSEARKYKLNLTIAHQYVEQMSEEVRAAVFGNVGTMIVFRVGSIDAEQFEREFAPKFLAEDIVNLGKYQMYLRLMIDGMGSQPFSATNLPPIAPPPVSLKPRVIESSQLQFGHPREQVEEYIRLWMEGKSQDTKSSTVSSNNVEPVKKAPTVASPSPVQSPVRQPGIQNTHNQQAYSQESRKPVQKPQFVSHTQHPQFTRPQGGPERSKVSETRVTPPVSQKPIQTPPPDTADGFAGLDSLKKLAQQSKPFPVNNQTRENRFPERKGVTPESRNDLKEALAALIKPQQNTVKPVTAEGQKIPQNPASHETRQQVHKENPVQNPVQKHISRETDQKQVDTTKKVDEPQHQKGVQEVPLDVLKKILE